MTKEEIDRDYPGAAFAVALHEGLIVIPEVFVGIFKASRKKGLTAAQMLEGLLFSARVTLQILPGLAMAKALPEMTHPDFRRYLEWKLGGERKAT